MNLEELLLGQPARCNVVALTECDVGMLPPEAFQTWIKVYPEVSQALSQSLARGVVDLAAQFNHEQDRQTALLPYRVPKVERGIVGSSRYAVRLRQQIIQAAGDREPVLVFGEPGLEKDNCCALIHFSSADRREPLIKVNCNQLQASGSDLFGRVGGKPGLLEWLGRGTLILNNIQDLPPALETKLLELLQTGSFTPTAPTESDHPVTAIPCQARILMISEKSNPELKPWIAAEIKVPPLRVRKTDIKAQADYYISLYARSRGIPRPQLTPEALRRLQAYDFPGNLKELRILIERAIFQAGATDELTDEVLWASTQVKGRSFRVNLLNAYPLLRRILRSPWWPDWMNTGVVAPLFALTVFILFWGPQDRAHNIGLNLFWAWWWPVILIIFPFLGRIWCAFCPFMIYGEIIQKVSLWLVPRPLHKWPRQWADRWGGWILVTLFGLIFIWEEVWDLQNTAYLSSWLLLLITGGAVVCSLIFERRFWCRYLCPIGGMNGLYAKLSMTELRAQQGTCSAECTTYQCYKGGPQKGEGQATNGCPLYSHPAQLQDNKDCVLCMTCLKACPHRSVEVNLRPPGIELWTTHSPRWSEVTLLLLLLGGIYLHRLPDIQSMVQLPFTLELKGSHLLASTLILVLPTLIPVLGYGLIRLISTDLKPRSFVELAYGYLPLVLGGTLAHYVDLGLSEAGRILPVTMATFGLSVRGLPVVMAHPAVIAFLQGSVLLISLILSVVLTQQIAKHSIGRLWPHHLSTLLLTGSLWILIVGR